MNKTYLNEKIARKFIIEGRDNGKSDQEIYNELSQQYFDKYAIALLITAIATPENKNRYKTHNNVLLWLLGFIILFNSFVTTNLITHTGRFLPHCFVLGFICILIILMYHVKKYNGAVYISGGFLIVAMFCQMALHTAVNGVGIVINAIFTAAIVGLLFYLGKNMFPLNPRKMKRVKDEYLFE